MSTAGHTPKGVQVSISLRWRRAGEATANFVGENIYSIWMPPQIPGKAGMYRISIARGSGKLVYIGESAYLPKRVWHYARTQKQDSRRPEARLTREIRRALHDREPVVVDTATT